jgi:hypothetical protein
MSDGFLSRWSKRKAGKLEDLEEQPKEAAQTPAPITPETQAPPPASFKGAQRSAEE